MVGRTLAGAHAGFGRLGRDRLIGEDADPHLATALDMSGDGTPGRLDLAAVNPSGFEYPLVNIRRRFTNVEETEGAALAEDRINIDPAGTLFTDLKRVYVVPRRRKRADSSLSHRIVMRFSDSEGFLRVVIRRITDNFEIP